MDMKDNKDFLSLSLEDFTFAILGRDTSHFANDVDEWFNINNFGYKEVAKYLKCASDDWDEDILKAIKDDMELAFETFMFCSTSVATPAGIESGIKVEYTVPEHIVWISEKGKQCDISYNGEEIYCDCEPFDCIPMIDAQRESKGLPPLKTLDFNHFKRALATGIHDLFVRLQRKHFECHTLYAYAMELVNRHLGLQIAAKEDAQTFQPDTTTRIIKSDELRLPPELDADRTRKYFARAMEVGWICCTARGYKWTFGGERGGKARLAYFIEHVYCPSPTDVVGHDRIKAIEKLFEVARLDRALQQNVDSGKSQAVKRWRSEIDSKIFFD